MVGWTILGVVAVVSGFIIFVDKHKRKTFSASFFRKAKRLLIKDIPEVSKEGVSSKQPIAGYTRERHVVSGIIVNSSGQALPHENLTNQYASNTDVHLEQFSLAANTDDVYADADTPWGDAQITKMLYQLKTDEHMRRQQEQAPQEQNHNLYEFTQYLTSK